jgi:flagellin
MDGGMNNISQMLDRLKTLAMQSSSDAFTGGVTGRATLNGEFQNDLKEIDRQAQSIGLNQGGAFAKSLAVYLGAGSGSQSATNAVVTVDLSKSTVDAQSLGLAGYQAVKLGATVTTDYDLGSASTGVSAILAVATGGQSGAAGTFTLTGPGFGDASGIDVVVNYNGVNNSQSLVAAINAGIQTAGAGTQTAAVTAMKAANITASIHTDSAGKQQLTFTSGNTAFEVVAKDLKANALMGNVGGDFKTATALATADRLISGGAYQLGTSGGTGAASNTESDVAWALQTTGGTDAQAITISASDSTGGAHALTITTGLANQDTMAHLLLKLNGDIQASNDTTLKAITAVGNAAGDGINFISNLSTFSVAIDANGGASGGLTATTVKQAIQVGAGGVADISTVSGAQAAVAAVTSAVSALGSAQAGIGKGQNQLNYAINLAQSQITNLSAAESQIRDTNVAQQAANLSKAQTLSQAAIAAMAQANSAPQAVLSLLRG